MPCVGMDRSAHPAGGRDGAEPRLDHRHHPGHAGPGRAGRHCRAARRRQGARPAGDQHRARPDGGQHLPRRARREPAAAVAGRLWRNAGRPGRAAAGGQPFPYGRPHRLSRRRHRADEGTQPGRDRAAAPYRGLGAGHARSRRHRARLVAGGQPCRARHCRQPVGALRGAGGPDQARAAARRGHAPARPGTGGRTHRHGVRRLDRGHGAIGAGRRAGTQRDRGDWSSAT